MNIFVKKYVFNDLTTQSIQRVHYWDTLGHDDTCVSLQTTCDKQLHVLQLWCKPYYFHASMGCTTNTIACWNGLHLESPSEVWDPTAVKDDLKLATWFPIRLLDRRVVTPAKD